MALRFLQVFGATPSITVGMVIINDISWEHGRGFRVGLWVMPISAGIYAGPLSEPTQPYHLHIPVLLISPMC